MLKARLRLNKTDLRILIITLLCMPAAAHADWMQTIQTYGTNIRVGIYALAGTIAVSSMVWKGIQWLAARAAGDHSTTFMDYLQQILVIVAVGGAVVIATAAWGVYGSGATT